VHLADSAKALADFESVLPDEQEELPQAREAEKDIQRLHPHFGDNGTSGLEELSAALEGATRFVGTSASLTDARARKDTDQH
jgi:hypothetical protein